MLQRAAEGSTADTSAVTLIQRFGSALNLNIHFHMLFLDGVYIDGANGNKNNPHLSVRTLQLPHP
jgi:hypothetical protein